MPKLQFWFEFASTYTYLSAMRIERLAVDAGVEVDYRPFLLGPIFRAQGWDTSPFAIYEAKGNAMWRDVERECERLGLPFVRPATFPVFSLYAARTALVAKDEGWVTAFTAAAYTAIFAKGQDIADQSVLDDCIRAADGEPDHVRALAARPETKARLRAETETAQSLGIFGAPTFITENGELFWGNDRLERALEWAVRET